MQLQAYFHQVLEMEVVVVHNLDLVYFDLELLDRLRVATSLASPTSGRNSGLVQSLVQFCSCLVVDGGRSLLVRLGDDYATTRSCIYCSLFALAHNCRQYEQRGDDQFQTSHTNRTIS